MKPVLAKNVPEEAGVDDALEDTVEVVGAAEEAMGEGAADMVAAVVADATNRSRRTAVC